MKDKVKVLCVCGEEFYTDKSFINKGAIPKFCVHCSKTYKQAYFELADSYYVDKFDVDDFCVEVRFAGVEIGCCGHCERCWELPYQNEPLNTSDYCKMIG